ncbi:MAG: hypothetical protein ACTHL8_21525 [Burkholderiaceae bacterium]
MTVSRIAASCALAATLVAGVAPARALGVPMDDQALSDTWGQALLDLTNTTDGQYQFSRLTFNADVTLSMNLNGLKLGTQANGTSDIDIATMNFGRSDATDAQRTVAISKPYFEWVYSGTAGSADRQVVGMRLGFGSMTGDLGLSMNTVSGALSFASPDGTTTYSANGKGTTTLASSSGGSLALNQVGGVTADASRDFFISVLKSAVAFPSTDASMAAPAQSQAGFWMNWTDRLKAINTTGQTLPNVPKIGP